MAGGVHGRGCAWQGDMCGRGACMAEGHVWQRGMRGRTDGHCSGRYASYWNVFLLLVNLVLFQLLLVYMYMYVVVDQIVTLSSRYK